MSSALGDYVRRARNSLGWSYGDAARALAYKNLNKGMRRLQHLDDGIGDREFLEKVIAVFALDAEEVNRRIAADARRERLEFNEWADQPTEPEIFVHLISGISTRRSLEGARTQMELFDRAREACRQFGGLRTYLVISRRLTFLFRNGEFVGWEEAKPNFPTLPFTIIGGKPCQITFAP